VESDVVLSATGPAASRKTVFCLRQCLASNPNLRNLWIFKTSDVIIATGCIELSLELLHNDRDFVPMEQILGLKVVKRI